MAIVFRSAAMAAAPARMRASRLLLLIGLLGAPVAPRPAEAQFAKLVKERIKQKVEERKQQTRDNLLNKAAEPADSALERIMSPVDSAAARAGGKAGSAVARVGRGPDPAAAEEAGLRQQVEGGRAELARIAFEPGSDAMNVTSEPTLVALARILAGQTGTFLIQARADPGTAAEAVRPMAEARAVGVKAWLVGSGVPAERIFAVSDGAAAPEQALASVVRMQ